MAVRRIAALVRLVMLTWLCPVIVLAYPETHPPFPAGSPAPYPSPKLDAVIDYTVPAEFHDGQIRVSVEPRSEGHVATVVWVGQKKILDTAEAYGDIPLPVGSRVYYSDITGDGRKDLLIYSSPAGNGLGARIEMADMLVARADGSYQHASFEAYAAGPEDFIDVNGDGRYEMLWVNYYFKGGHSYWVYRVAEITDEGLQLNDTLVPDFPKIIWFTEKPNDTPTQKLTAVECEDLIHQSTAKWQETYFE